MNVLRRLRLLLPALLASALLAAGYGGDGGSEDPRVEEAVDQCLEGTKQIQDEKARKTAEEACKAAESGDEERVKDAALQQCLDAARQFPGDARKTAEKRCRDQLK